MIEIDAGHNAEQDFFVAGKLDARGFHLIILRFAEENGEFKFLVAKKIGKMEKILWITARGECHLSRKFWGAGVDRAPRAAVVSPGK